MMMKKGIFGTTLAAVLAFAGADVFGDVNPEADILLAQGAQYEAAGSSEQAVAIYYRAATEFNSAPAMRKLGIAYAEGRGVAVNPEYALYYFQQAAAQRDIEAIHQLGMCYYNGFGTEQNVSAALGLWASISGLLPEADYCIGVCYSNGFGNVAADGGAAARHLTLAANAGHIPAKRELALLYERGFGVPRDYRMAYELLREAAEAGDAQAEYHLGRYYEEGICVARDLEYAYIYYYRARQRGYQNAQWYLDRLTSRGFRPRRPHPPIPEARHKHPSAGYRNLHFSDPRQGHKPHDGGRKPHEVKKPAPKPAPHKKPAEVKKLAPKPAPGRKPTEVKKPAPQPTPGRKPAEVKKPAPQPTPGRKPVEVKKPAPRAPAPNNSPNGNVPPPPDDDRRGSRPPQRGRR